MSFDLNEYRKKGGLDYTDIAEDDFDYDYIDEYPYGDEYDDTERYYL